MPLLISPYAYFASSGLQASTVGTQLVEYAMFLSESLKDDV